VQASKQTKNDGAYTQTTAPRHTNYPHYETPPKTSCACVVVITCTAMLLSSNGSRESTEFHAAAAAADNSGEAPLPPPPVVVAAAAVAGEVTAAGRGRSKYTAASATTADAMAGGENFGHQRRETEKWFRHEEAENGFDKVTN
jgi:hypothetical protein